MKPVTTLEELDALDSDLMPNDADLADQERELRIQAHGLLVPPWTDAEINRFLLRVGLFDRRGLSADAFEKVKAGQATITQVKREIKEERREARREENRAKVAEVTEPAQVVRCGRA